MESSLAELISFWAVANRKMQKNMENEMETIELLWRSGLGIMENHMSKKMENEMNNRTET